MSRERLDRAEEALMEMEKHTEKEERELSESLQEARQLHQEHMRELKEDEEFLNDIQNLVQELDVLRRIDEHLIGEIEKYESGNEPKNVFREHLQQDESRFVNVREQIHKDLEDMVVELGQERRLTQTDEEVEESEQRLAHLLNQEQQRIENTHQQVAQALEVEASNLG
jgi:membrane-associated HD superfamily phosphohydrolase